MNRFLSFLGPQMRKNGQYCENFENRGISHQKQYCSKFRNTNSLFFYELLLTHI